ncbi:stage II sporulation protein D [Oceanobacillus piezotolerans]|uniref:Stage II sporulation protein D n=2 Tax=Oceanobacillus piezotolerans TaxID=2448030 RepID=A0A498DKR4_9BACI|nr:stage II sporulation protein D [Oceanobacillus piezotolerans]
MKKKQAQHLYAKNQKPRNVKKVVPFSQNKGPYIRPNRSRWSIPTVVSLSSLITIILVIPTLIVFPFYEQGEEVASHAKEVAAPVETETASSSFAVEVMRHATETVENIPLEDYVAGVVASEMPATFELEALKAQALAARTYTVNYLLHGESAEGYDLTDTVQHQVYKSEEDLRREWGSEFSEKMSKIKEAVNATTGEILTYNDAPITASYFSTSNGYTENSEDYWESELPYLRSVESPWDVNSPKFLHQETFTIDQIETALEIDLPSETPLYIEEARTEGGRIKEIGIEGHTFTGKDFRNKLNLKSSDFTITQNNGHFVVTTEGFGHGVGMSQYGAHYMAEEGKTYKDIIAHYYQGVDISTVDDTAPTLVAR